MILRILFVPGAIFSGNADLYPRLLDTETVAMEGSLGLEKASSTKRQTSAPDIDFIRLQRRRGDTNSLSVPPWLLVNMQNGIEGRSEGAVWVAVLDSLRSRGPAKFGYLVV